VKRHVAAVLLACVCSTAPAWAQDPPAPAEPYQVTTAGEPVSLVVAMGGIVVASAGFGLMLHQSSPCYCGPATAWVVGGVVVVAAGVTMVWLGLRPRTRTVIIAPTITKQTVGGLAVIRWGS